MFCYFLDLFFVLVFFALAFTGDFLPFLAIAFFFTAEALVVFFTTFFFAGDTFLAAAFFTGLAAVLFPFVVSLVFLADFDLAVFLGLGSSTTGGSGITNSSRLA